jgi:heterodisulfide reductase subunit C
MKGQLNSKDFDPEFSRKVREESGVNVNLCYQCSKCAAGCPVAYEMDLTPSQLIHAIRLGQRELVLKSKTMWLCSTCETCTTRCPQEVDIARVMDAVKIIARQEKVKARVPDVRKFYDASLQNIRWFGRMYEIGLIMMLKLKTRDFFKDLVLGQRMIMKGKLKLMPTRTNIKAVKEIFSRVKKMEAEQAKGASK